MRQILFIGLLCFVLGIIGASIVYALAGDISVERIFNAVFNSTTNIIRVRGV